MWSGKINIAIVDVALSVKWLPAKTPTAKENGSIRSACSKRLCLKSGIVLTARSKKTKLRTLTLVDIL